MLMISHPGQVNMKSMVQIQFDKNLMKSIPDKDHLW